MPLKFKHKRLANRMIKTFLSLFAVCLFVCVCVASEHMRVNKFLAEAKYEVEFPTNPKDIQVFHHTNLINRPCREIPEIKTPYTRSERKLEGYISKLQEEASRLGADAIIVTEKVR
ncbi:MAG: hypothetical protein Nk1A_6910 [Endomicrobiia bacterium]|nr:MAG: hypothetical protein Nk1A_6910 [Endomicrobiia bacterium]